MSGLIQQLIERGPVITDGALGTQLQLRGLSSGDCPDEWNLSHPDLVGDVARAYVAAGSRIILTNTFGANRIRLAGHGLEHMVNEINRAGVGIARNAAGSGVAVFGSMGPSGKMLMMGDVSADELASLFTEQAAALAAAGVDAIVCETFSDLDEAKIALAAAKTTGLPVVVSLVFDTGKEKDRTMMGVTPETAVAELLDGGADVIGGNCGQSIEGYVAVCRRMRAATDRPLWIKANAGNPEMSGGVVVYRTTPEEFCGHVPELIMAGANFIGGCCGTSPDFIAGIRRVINGE